ncbi:MULTISPECIES: site-specific DNA-methyltransferase [unclassified Mesorhizobium]|uniref:site-specific DNA-methyltransferase n=1 Tax=unclassified Mesorhizobium TaxID=325217 RepID=UPI00112E1DB0|nr:MULTISPECIES: site-specific DNA-methyltransferase [unclassified Mesorhizobium]TPK53814.1 site-specific DNA-methyltransferase [Mesorhizobium sp. B2-5-2]TPL17177.1 site-specific DNA-methyltransferase [Mesorhizobium sp. B2-4-7]TPL33412.1 site-specific DNA-methyltransferase [Mesorhizobium sp. B2-4-5]TPM69148.1 site-specific DNA-methyltransferase [Mesorhizobium sp. B2-1-6]TPN73633.1 site-specific DNA-methyltransferase [Mesorhizobium sp. B1-1-2]
MSKKQKLELTWIGKDERHKLEPRILIEDSSLSHHATARRSESDIFDNMLIHGDNLLALKALEADFAGKVKCVFIDPPYNTGSAFTHYDDGLEHSLWLSLMRDRLEMMRTLLSDDGSLWITIDDNEAHYLKVLCDEVFGRANFVANVVWEKADSPRNSARLFSTDHDHILIFSKNASWTPRKLARTDEANSIYSNPDNDPRGDWLPGDPYANKPYSKGLYSIVGPTGRTFTPPAGRFWRISQEKLHQLDQDGRIWWGPTGNARPSIKKYVDEVGDLVPRTLWKKEAVGSNRTSKNESRSLFPGDVSFETPKPERLIQRILDIATNPGDLVLDSFAGSGTTGAVAHKMGRRWIMVELGNHAETHVVPRLRKVIDDDDSGGITETVGWKGGGGFRFYRLAPSLLIHDKYGNWVIAKDYNAAMLAEALCKHMSFTYAPSQNADEYWNHGFSTETDFIYVTTQNLTHDACRKISEDVGPDRSLLICCKAFNANPDSFENLTLVKIPTAILSRCEWGRDDYSLNIQNLPLALDEPEEPRAPGRSSRKKDSGLPLFNLSADEGEA